MNKIKMSALLFSMLASGVCIGGILKEVKKPETEINNDNYITVHVDRCILMKKIKKFQPDVVCEKRESDGLYRYSFSFDRLPDRIANEPHQMEPWDDGYDTCADCWVGEK